MDDTAKESSSTVLKRDALGRVTVSRDQREALVDEFERSGLKGAQFARLAGINYGTFAYWMQQRRHQRGDYAGMKPMKVAARSSMLRLVEAVPTPGSHSGGICALEVKLPGGASVRIDSHTQAALAAQLIKALHTSC
jgi:transposase-like protein